MNRKKINKFKNVNFRIARCCLSCSYSNYMGKLNWNKLFCEMLDSPVEAVSDCNKYNIIKINDNYIL